MDNKHHENCVNTIFCANSYKHGDGENILRYTERSIIFYKVEAEFQRSTTSLLFFLVCSMDYVTVV